MNSEPSDLLSKKMLKGLSKIKRLPFVGGGNLSLRAANVGEL
jgi:hypothetical protein